MRGMTGAVDDPVVLLNEVTDQTRSDLDMTGTIFVGD